MEVIFQINTGMYKMTKNYTQEDSSLYYYTQFDHQYLLSIKVITTCAFDIISFSIRLQFFHNVIAGHAWLVFPLLYSRLCLSFSQSTLCSSGIKIK